MDAEKLREVLELHREWLSTGGGIRANLQGADLQGADLQEANLQEADLLEADLQEADLQRADLHGADLHGADLREANLRGADLREANLHGADLHGANLQRATLWRANLQGADLQRANLQEANLREANLHGAVLPDFLIVPPEGSFVAWKKCKDGDVVKLLIPETAKRHNCISSRKCRASEAKVLQIMDSNGLSLDAAKGTYDSLFVYRTGELVIPNSYDPDIRIECSNGIHFFLTKEEAEQYSVYHRPGERK